MYYCCAKNQGSDSTANLTLLVLVYEIFVLQKPMFSPHFHATLQLQNLPGDWAGKLFKHSKDATIFLFEWKKVWSFWFLHFLCV